MSAKHTPSPWEVGRKIGHQIPVWSAAMDGLRQNVAHVSGIRCGEGEANARLISAAPDLLRALELLVAGIENSVSGTYIPLVTARAAIAKALGNDG